MASYSWLQKKFDLDEYEAAAVEWQYRFCGDFTAALWEAIMRAKGDNWVKLWLGFPVYAQAYKMYSTDYDWWPNIQKKIPGSRSELSDGQ